MLKDIRGGIEDVLVEAGGALGHAESGTESAGGIVAPVDGMSMEMLETLVVVAPSYIRGQKTHIVVFVPVNELCSFGRTRS